MKLKIATVMIIALCSCNNKEFEKALIKNDTNIIEGKFLVDNVYFPQDTLILLFYKDSDTSKIEKLQIELKNDSIYLSNYNFGPWYGKWFCNFHNAKAKFENNHLNIFAHYDNTLNCENKNATQKIKYKLINQTDSSYTLLKIKDTSDCQPKIYDLLFGRGSKKKIVLR
jgi:hypothetical protein